VHATRTLANAWEQEVRRQVTRRGTTVGEAGIREELTGSFGTPTLAALVGVLMRADGWEADGEGFRHALDGGHVTYHPATRELEIVARAESEVEVSAEASTVVAGQLTDTVDADGEGTYYDDEWAGHTRRRAEADAEADAARALDAQAANLAHEARRRAEEDQGASVEAQAARRADAAFAQASADRTEQLRRDAAARLDAVGVQGRAVFHQALADAYRDAILAYARSRRAEGVRCTRDGGVLDIEFEIEL
jgi:hypothetical protein